MPFTDCDELFVRHSGVLLASLPDEKYFRTCLGCEAWAELGIAVSIACELWLRPGVCSIQLLS